MSIHEMTDEYSGNEMGGLAQFYIFYTQWQFYGSGGERFSLSANIVVQAGDIELRKVPLLLLLLHLQRPPQTPIPLSRGESEKATIHSRY